MKKELYLDFWTLTTLQDDGEICCPSCGSWTEIENLSVDGEGIANCPLCQ